MNDKDKTRAILDLALYDEMLFKTTGRGLLDEELPEFAEHEEQKIEKRYEGAPPWSNLIECLNYWV